jgi:glycolate oxidase iron-sulfur subunit
MASMPGDAPILVDSAGCGAALKDYGRLVQTSDAVRFAARVRDVHEWLALRAGRLPEPREEKIGPIAVQDPCHLRHVQRSEKAVRVVLARYAELVELDDEGMCCGAGGAYSALHPQLAMRIREEKVAAIRRTGAALVASANPGCSIWLAAAGIDVVHPMEIVARTIGPRGGERNGG